MKKGIANDEIAAAKQRILALEQEKQTLRQKRSHRSRRIQRDIPWLQEQIELMKTVNASSTWMTKGDTPWMPEAANAFTGAVLAIVSYTAFV